MKERTKLLLMLAVFATAWFLLVQNEHFMNAVYESLKLLKWYAQDHVLLCLIPAFFIAGVINVFVSQGAVMKYLGPSAKKLIAYPVVAVSEIILAVCSCTVLPLFASIHKRGAFSDELPMLLLALVNHDPDSTKLRTSIRAIASKIH